MKIEIWGNDHRDFPEYGPYKLLDTIEKNDLYQIGDMTHYGPVISLLPFPAGRSGDVNQSASCQIDAASMATRPIESIRNKKPHARQIRFFPIRADPLGYLKIRRAWLIGTRFSLIRTSRSRKCLDSSHRRPTRFGSVTVSCEKA